MHTYFFGISYFPAEAPRFQPWPLSVKSSTDLTPGNFRMGKGKNRHLWIIHNNLRKLQVFDPAGTTSVTYNLQLSPAADYYSFYLENDNILWAAGNAVLTRVDLKTGSYRDYPTWLDGQATPEDGRVFELLEDSQGRFWVVGTFGALLFDKGNGRFVKYKTVSYSQGILEDSRQNIWIGGGDEVFLLKKNGKDFERLLTDKRRSGGNFASVWRLCEDAKGRIWAATRQGLQLFKPDQNRFELDNGIELESVEDIRTDPEGYLWLETVSELVRYHPDKGTLQIYGYQDGLPFNAVFRPASGVEDINGTLYFSTGKGTFRFSPREIHPTDKLSPVVFTSLKLSNSEISPGDPSGLLPQNINQLEQLVLKHNQNIFSLDFALLSYQRSERNRYAYRLERFDQDWTYTGVPSATYMNLPPGTYRFQVKAANGDGFWLEQPRQLRIEVLPPWWKTWYAYVLYLALAGTAAYLMIRFFWLRTTLRKENELYQDKLDFFTNVSHEVRTHLSLVAGPLEKAFDLVSDNTPAKSHLTYARSNSVKLMQLVNELLDFRKIQSGGVKLQAHEYDVVKIIKSVLASFEHLAADKGIETVLETSGASVMLWFDLAQMQKVFYNLLGNAYKFTPEGGIVRVVITETAAETIIQVINTGKGIAPQHLEHLFQNFFQGPDARQTQNGYGIGLSLSRGIVDLHKGQLTVTSDLPTDDDSGQTCFTLRLLAGNGHYAVHQLGSFEDPVAIVVDWNQTGQISYPDGARSPKKNTILLIEDNNELRAFEKEVFSEDYHVLDAADGLEGLNIAREQLPDLVLCDVMMPELNGLEVCSRLKSDIRTSHIPVVLLTARTAVSQIVEGLETGADDYLVKPFDPNVLTLKVNNLIRSREQLRLHYSRILSLEPDEVSDQDMDAQFLSVLRNTVLENIADSGFGVTEMAFKAGVSVSVLYRKLRALTGMTAKDFIKAIKMNKALQLLESARYNVGEVALATGYEDVRHFSKEFRKTHGRYPSEFRKQAFG